MAIDRRAPGIAPAASAPSAVTGDQLPDLAMAQLKDFSIRKSGSRRLLRYSTTIVNLGSGPFEIQGARTSTSESMMTQVSQRIYDDAGNWRDVATPAEMEWGGDGHNHWHVHDLQLQEMFNLADGSNAGRSDKRGFCFWDNVRYQLSLPGAPQSDIYEETGCGDSGSLSTHMGLSIGWGDIYPYVLPDQNVDITRIRDGNYRLVVTADPLGMFAESNESNNSTYVDLNISHKGSRVRILGYGPQATIASR